MQAAYLALEDGTVFEGDAFGAPVERVGEVVFNTSITGYQEILTDPSYAGQIVVLTAPQIGNYGTTPEDNESAHPQVQGLIVREFSSVVSNWRSDLHTNEFLARHQVPVGSGFDTRAIVRRLRDRGAMRGVLSCTGNASPAELVEKAGNAPKMQGLDLASTVSTAEPYDWNKPVAACSPSDLVVPPADPRFRVVAYDFGIKRNILRRLVSCGCEVTVVPAGTPAEEVLERNPHGVFLSNGPGDPEPLEFQAEQTRKILGRVPLFGICLGHQVMGLALGGKTYKLKFGHRGGNHPVLNKRTGQVEITAQNHGFVVDPDSLKDSEVDLTHWNLNDQTLEGLRHRHHPAFCVQYHPEAAPGPHDSQYLFQDFIQMMEEFWKMEQPNA